MSSNNRGADNQKKSTKETRQQRIVRAVCLFLAILMILSCVSVLAYVFGSSFNVAADSDYGFPNNLIAVGLECGTSEVAVGFELSTTNGFVVNEAVIGRDERSSTRIYTLTEEDVFIACDVNLSKSSGKYTKYDGNKAAVGGYHIQITEKMVDSGGIKVPQKLDITSETQLRDLIAEIDSLVNGTSYNAIPCYIDNKYEVRIGDFSSADNAQKGIEKLTELSKLYNVKVVEPSATAVSIIEPNLNKVLFEYDCYSQLGLSSSSGGYLRTYQSRLYGGTMCYKRDSGGVQVTSLIDFEEYVKCVVPWEISASWNYNALTAFSIVVRTFALGNIHRRFKAHGVDLYDDSTDQVYGGYSRVTEKVEQACAETKGQVVFYGGALTNLYYSSSTGGYVVSNSDVWGSSPIPYLSTKATPWENYVDRGSAMWRSEVSPSELSSYVRTLKGCSNITSPIDSVIIESTAGESGYVKSITFVDTAGNKATVGNTTAKVKSALYDYVKSANFVVGKDSVDFKYNIIKTVTVSTGKEPEPFYEQNPGYFDKFLISDYKVKTSAQKLLSAGGNFLAMLTHVGRQSVTVDRANVLTADGYKRLYELGIDIDNIYKNVSDAAPQLLEAETSNTSSTAVGEEAVSVDLLEVTETIKASKEGYFVFAGKGWGHGVGMSQYGVLDLANAGMSGEGILKTYFKGVTISTY